MQYINEMKPFNTELILIAQRPTLLQSARQMVGLTLLSPHNGTTPLDLSHPP